MKRIFVMSSAMVIGLSGCGDTNPETAGLFDNINNLNSGEYDRQIAESEAEAARIAKDNARQRSTIASLNKQKNANNATASRLRAQIASVQSELSSIRSSVSGDSGKVARLNKLQGQLNAVSSDVSAGASAEAVSRELRGIRQAMRALKS